MTKHWITNTMATRSHLVYRGRMVDRVGTEWRIYHQGNQVHTAQTQTDAMEWIDRQIDLAKLGRREREPARKATK